jgi:hypothetical protein
MLKKGGIKMKKFYICSLIIAVIFLVSGIANADKEFRAELTGDEEVPPVQTETTGKAEFEVDDDSEEIEFELEIKNAVDILGAVGAHIHCAPKGENGPIIADLAGIIRGGFEGKVEISATLTDANIQKTDCGSSIDEVVKSMEDGDTYVNVHSAANLSGEVRGQIRLISDDDNDDLET